MPTPATTPERDPGFARLTWLAALAMFGVSAVALAHFHAQSSKIVSYDAFYHIKYAWLLRVEGWLSEFPWAARSLWADGFADKEILYHVLLIPFTWIDDLTVASKVAGVVMGALALTTCGLVWRLERLRLVPLWFVLLLGSGAAFIFRIGVPRPHVLSLILVTWSVWAVLNRRRWTLGILTLLYSLSYTGFHLSLVLAVVASVVLWLARGEVDWRTPAVVLGAGALGMLVNPFFPNNLHLLWVQNVLVPWIAIFGDVDLEQGSELLPFSTKVLILSVGAVTLPWISAMATQLFHPRAVSLRTLQLFGISATAIAMTLLSRRFVEYAIPLTLWFCASFFTDRLDGRSLGDLWRRAAPRARRMTAAATAGGLVVLAALLLMSYRATAVEYSFGLNDLQGAADYLETHTDEGEVVFTCDWDDAPRLFFHNHRSRYLVMLDPAFMYFWDADYWERWLGLGNGEHGARTYELLAEEFRYGVCTASFEELRWIIDNDPRMEVVYEDDVSYVFFVDRDNPDIDLEDFLRLSSP